MSAIVRRMTATALVGATSDGRARLMVRESASPRSRTPRSPGRSMSTMAGTIATPGNCVESVLPTIARVTGA